MNDTLYHKPENPITTETPVCYHCGQPCRPSDPRIGDKYFCCPGCKTVYEILHANDLCRYYDLENMPGITPAKTAFNDRFAFLDDETIGHRLLDFSDGKKNHITFYIPAIHCVSCVWLLENLAQLNNGILSSRVDYLKKELRVIYADKAVSLRQIVELLAAIGYEPELNLQSLESRRESKVEKELYIRLGLAGFCFANIMLLSFPEYLISGGELDARQRLIFSWMSAFLSLPVLLYSSAEYFKSAWRGFKERFMNMDIPLSLGIIVLFLRSMFEVVAGSGQGYFDSFAGLVFFLLLGKLFEKKTYAALSFERDYRSYFPLSVIRKSGDKQENISVEKLKPGDRIIIRNQELIPADGVLIDGAGLLDYSFVSGESALIENHSGDYVYAGGKQCGSAIELEIIREVNQSYLTQLWNDEAFRKSGPGAVVSMANRISKHFTVVVITIALAAFFFWLPRDAGAAFNALTAVLIVACPCALALSTPFALGNTMRILGRNKIYLKNTYVIEKLASANMIVFDKTGTLTSAAHTDMHFVASDPSSALLAEEEACICSLAMQSTHPLSQQLTRFLDAAQSVPVTDFNEIPGQGISGMVNDHAIKIGSAGFIGQEKLMESGGMSSRAFITIDGVYRGYYVFHNQYRPELADVIQNLGNRYELVLLTGDNEGEKERLVTFFAAPDRLYFRQSPTEKLAFVRQQQQQGRRILMVGDGLNDAGALQVSDVGLALAEDINTFTPASDVIMDAQQFGKLPEMIRLAGKSMQVIKVSFLLSFIYNAIGLAFAVSGTLSPLIAALLMPASSISVVLFTTGITAWIAAGHGFHLFAPVAGERSGISL